MSIFQCQKCGCSENTADTECFHCMSWMNREYTDKDTHPGVLLALQSYKRILGLRDDESFGYYCSACCPLWFEGKSYGVGPNPDPQPGEGMWHGEWERTFLPKGKFETNPDGNLWHKETHDTDIKKYRLPKEEGT